MREEEKLYFTEITENEKRIINLVRTYIVPLGSVEDYVDFLVDNVAQKLIDKTVKLQAFTEVMQHERDNSDVSNLEMLARLNQFETYIQHDETLMNKYVTAIIGDIASNLEGDIKPIEVYSPKDMIYEEEKRLDKMQ